MNLEQRRLIMNSFIICNFSYCPAVWMFHCRKLNAHINRLHERALRVVYRDFNSFFGKLLRRDSSATLHHRNLQKLMTEMFKIKTGITPEFLKINETYLKLKFIFDFMINSIPDEERLL